MQIVISYKIKEYTLRLAALATLLLFTNQLESKTAVVTGGAGFLGSHLCDALLARGDQVICVDNLSSGSIANISHLDSNCGFRFIEHDIINPLTIDEPIDEIYNCACAASPIYYQIDPIHTLRTNFIGMTNLLELAIKKGAKVLQTSTSEVYGDPDIHPQPESYWGNVNPYGPRSCYDEGKRVVESLCYAYREMHDLDIKIMRIFNTYGPRMHANDGRVVSNFIVQALEGKALTIYGDGSQTRSLCYVDDLIRGFLLMMDTPKEVSGPINLGNPSNELTILNIAKTVLQLTGSESTMTFKPLPQDDPKRRQPDIIKAEEILGWTPRISLKDGLSQTINYYKGLNADKVCK